MLALLLALLVELPAYPAEGQTGPHCRPWPFGMSPSSPDRIEARLFTYPEPIPPDVSCPTAAPCLLARPDCLRPFQSGDYKDYQGFEFVLANPGKESLRLVFPGVLPIIRQAHRKGWEPVEHEPCWPFCGNANDVVSLPPGYCYRFIVPPYSGPLLFRQRFVLALNTGYLQSRVLISNEFEGLLAESQFLPVEPCPPEMPLIDTAK